MDTNRQIVRDAIDRTVVGKVSYGEAMTARALLVERLGEGGYHDLLNTLVTQDNAIRDAVRVLLTKWGNPS